MKTLILMMAMTCFTAATALAQPEDSVTTRCEFSLGKRAKRERFCTAHFSIEALQSARAVETPSLTIECDDDLIYQGQFTVSPATNSTTLDPGMALVGAVKNNVRSFPAIYIDGLTFAGSVKSAPANLRLKEDGRVIHGFCERGER